jgi:subtilisin family serine protease
MPSKLKQIRSPQLVQFDAPKVRLIGHLPLSRELFPLATLALLAMMTGCNGESSSSHLVQQPISLIEYGDSEIINKINQLKKVAAERGSVHLIVGLRTRFIPEGELSTGRIALQRAEIARTQSAILTQIASLGQRSLKLFTFIPFMAVEAGPTELVALLKLHEVVSLEEDRVAAPADAASDTIIGAATAWGAGFSGLGQNIAILDSGVDKTHPFLAGKVISEACFSTNNAADGATSICPGGVSQSTATGSAMPYSGACPAGECDHGTVVAGIAAGTSASFSGVARDAKIIAIQVFSAFNSIANCGSSKPCALTYTSDQILGLQQVYALSRSYPIAAVNMSLGSGQYTNQATCDAANSSIKAMIDTLRSVNIPTIIASGNDGYKNGLSAPACISTAISIGATFNVAGYNNNCAGNNLGISSVDAILCESNSASFLNLLAPGAEITSSVPGGAYTTWFGTSMAAPQVAGAWAIMKQKTPTLGVVAGLNALSATGIPVTDPRNGVVKSRIQIDLVLKAI